MPVTSPPRTAIASARIPPPHPMSRTRRPTRPPAMRSTQPRRSGLMSCNGLNSLFGSHQRWASAEKRASSAGSAFAIMAREAIRRSLEAGLPHLRARQQRRFVEGCELPLAQHRATADPGVRDIGARGDMHQMGYRIVHRLAVYAAEIDGDDVRLLARLQRSDVLRQPKRLRTTQ